MQVKLTLRLDDEVIRMAKESAREMGKSVSEMVEDFFRVVVSVRRGRKRGEPTPVVRELKGCLKGAGVDEEDYRRHLLEKYR